jgi:hypothetical protein
MPYIINSDKVITGLLKNILTNTVNIRDSVANDQAAWLCVSFTAANPAALQILVQNYFAVTQTGVLVNLSYTENGTGTQHTAYITINPTI